MPISINGNGTITGVSVGGLPDGIVDTDMLATDAVSAAKLGTNSFVSYAIICDQKASSSNGGTFTLGAWRTRDLNTEISDADSIVSISSNQFTLGAGTYLIRWSAPAYRVTNHVSKLYDVTNTADVQIGTSGYSESGYNVQDRSTGSARVVITGNTVYEIQHQSNVTNTTYGFGVGDITYDVNIFTIVEIFKEA